MEKRNISISLEKAREWYEGAQKAIEMLSSDELDALFK